MLRVKVSDLNVQDRSQSHPELERFPGIAKLVSCRDAIGQAFSFMEEDQ